MAYQRKSPIFHTLHIHLFMMPFTNISLSSGGCYLYIFNSLEPQAQGQPQSAQQSQTGKNF